MKSLAWVKSSGTVPSDEAARSGCPLEQMLRKMDEPSTPLLVRPGRVELGIVMKGMIDEPAYVPVNNLLRDVAHLFTDKVGAG